MNYSPEYNTLGKFKVRGTKNKVLVSTSLACYITISVHRHRPSAASSPQSAPAETEETKPAS